MSDKKKLIGRIAFAPDASKSQIYWKCPGRGCTEMHCFPYSSVRVPGITPIYQKVCETCGRSYIASLLNTTGASALLVVVFK